NVPGQAAQADSMKNFIKNTPVGNYLAITVIYDARTNMSESLYVALEALGSTMIRQATPGMSWALIGRKGSGGPGMTALEGLNNDTVLISMQVPNYYSYGSGSITTTGFTIPSSWESFHWRHSGIIEVTQSQIALLGVRPTGEMDTLQILPGDSINVDLSFLNPLTSGPRYSTFRHAALLSSTDALLTPVLKDWWIDFSPPPDLAISSRTVGSGSVPGGSALNLPVTIYNVGFQKSDSSRVVVSIYDKYNKAREIASTTVDSIPVGGSRSIVIPIQTVNFSRRVTLQVVVAPAKMGKDLVAENNTAYTTFYLSGGSIPTNIQIFADGTQIMDGDYISARPKILVRAGNEGEGFLAEQAEFFVNNKLVERTHAATLHKGVSKTAISTGELTFTPELPNGEHELKFRLARMNGFGEVDSIEHLVMVKVLNETRVLQVYNYPNPFATDTYFTFMLTGSRPPDELTIRIFTISGRKIREINVPAASLQVGFNRIYWDGRDNDGDEIANGYYFYRISVRGDGKTDAAVEKLAKLR
ncbi:MAG: hypothetical protein HY708_03140, partial [Ignavibacteriae bacterium]|nr:hypothetical protein [Ignavibacteriota bacterium]